MIRFSIVSLAMLALGAWSTTACGGSFEGDDAAGGASGTAGSTGNAGAGTTGRGGSGASAGTGSGGGGGGTCEWMDHTYSPGDSFPAGDGCNTCTCGEDGAVGCTEADCLMCSDLSAAYSEAIDEARECDPAAPDSCSELVFVGLQCGCDSFVNPEHADALARAAAAQQSYSEQQCGGIVLCGQCLPPTAAYCSAEGKCVDTYDMPSGVACMVGGVVYESGATGIPDPFSCNTCDCFDGQLACTEIGCPVECPEGSAPGSRCAQCGPTDGCEIVEHSCLPVCMDLCEGGVCLDGVCKSVCG
jgi:hypothetical protein